MAEDRLSHPETEKIAAARSEYSGTSETVPLQPMHFETKKIAAAQSEYSGTVPLQPMHFEAEGTVLVNDTPVPWRCISEETVFCDEKEKPEASIFSFSYFLTGGGGESRPVLFLYNGGPGSACLWLHTGMAGPWKMKYEDAVHPPVTPPYEMEENRDWLLDVCDIVMIDPVGTGYARLYQPEKADKYYNVRGDAKAVADFIELWLRKYKRRNSPVYLGGESYGTVRTPLVVQELMGGPLSLTGKMRGISVSGVILLGTVLHLGTDPLPVPREPMDLYTEAAVAWYHRPEGKKTLQEHLEEAWSFGTGRYLSLLFAKNALSGEEKDALARKLSSFTDVPAAYYKEHDFRMSLADFAGDASGMRGFDVGLYDGRYTMPHSGNPGTLDVVADDPAMGQYTVSMTSAMESILAKKLNIHTEREYNAIGFLEINECWKYEYQITPAQALVNAARRNRDFRVFLVAGLYDLVTSPGYARALTQQLDIPRRQLVWKEYESGHMPYLGEESRKAVTADIRAFLRRK